MMIVAWRTIVATNITSRFALLLILSPSLNSMMLTYYIICSRGDTFFEEIMTSICRVEEGEPHWICRNIWESRDSQLAHRGCELTDGAFSDDRLRRSELVCAVSLMAAAMQTQKREALRYVPVRNTFDAQVHTFVLYTDPNTFEQVFVYSASGHTARIVQAHYEHPHFIFRKTEHLIIGHKNIHGFKTLMRWIMNIPEDHEMQPWPYPKAGQQETAQQAARAAPH